MLISEEIAARLRDEVAAWFAADPDETTRSELCALIQKDPAEVTKRFEQPLTFGTAGLRGPLGAGPDHMNRVLVRMAAWAVGTLLLRERNSGLVIIGYDARAMSYEFAHDSARVMSHLGLDVELTDGVIPTPVLAFTVRDRRAIGGVMVTASHNPPGDNGYKVYWSDGAQIVSPTDTQVEALIASRGPLGRMELTGRRGPRIVAASELIGRYLDIIIGEQSPRRQTLVVVYTPLHGVGGRTTLDAFARYGLGRPIVVAEQFEPDGTFPTVGLPNPEEDGALDLAIATADRYDADLVVAHDPDADRLGLVVRHGAEWRVLTGDEIGTLLGDELLRCGSGTGRVVANSVVSSSSLGWVADHHGAEIRRTLPGFKWIIRSAIDEPDSDFVFGYEEALGFAIDAAVRDKDGISAAVKICELAGRLSLAGQTLLDRLDEIALRDGLAVTRQISTRFDDPAAIARLMSRLHDDHPVRLGEIAVIATSDWLQREPAADIIELDLGPAGRVLIRPSGTEAKLKAYIEATIRPVSDLAAARHHLDHVLDVASAAVSELFATTHD